MVLELVYGRSPSGLVYPLNLVLMLILLVAAISDLMLRAVPNWLIFLGLMVALIWAAVSSGLMGLGFMTLGLLGGVALFFPIYMVGMLGAGDVKLMGLVGAFLGLHQLLVSSLFIFLMGGLISLLMLRKSAAASRSVQVPYAVAIAAGVASHLWMFA